MTDRKTIDQITSDQLDQLYNEIDRLHAGEEDGYDPAAHPTPGQWIARFNQASPAERFDAASWAIGDAQRATACFYQNHKGQLAEQHQALTALARVRALRDSWQLMTLEPGQVRRLLDELTAALADEPQRTTPNNPPTSTKG